MDNVVVNIKTKQRAIILSTNSKFKTVLLEFEDGKTQTITTATLNKYWKEEHYGKI